jgi:ankyrin repeat protein
VIALLWSFIREPTTPVRNVVVAVIAGLSIWLFRYLSIHVFAPLFGRFMSNPLIYGIWQRDLNRVKRALRKGADPNSVDSGYARATLWTALMSAAATGSVEIVKALLEAGADVNKTGGTSYLHHERTPLMIAAGFDQAEIVKILIRSGAIVTKRDANGWTAFVWAVRRGGAHSVQALLESGAAPRDYDLLGDPLIAQASEWAEIDTVRLLLAYGADPDEAGPGGITALMRASSRGGSAIVADLLRAGANVSATDKNGWTAYMYAISAGHTAAADLLRSSSESHSKTFDRDQSIPSPDESLIRHPEEIASNPSQGNVSKREIVYRTLRVAAERTAKAKWQLRIRAILFNSSDDSINIDDIHVRVFEEYVPTAVYMTIGYRGEFHLMANNSILKEKSLSVRPGKGIEFVLVLNAVRVEGVPAYGYREESPTVSPFGPMAGYGPTEGLFRSVFGVLIDYYTATEELKRATVPSDCIYLVQALSEHSPCDDFKAIDASIVTQMRVRSAEDQPRLEIINKLSNFLQEHHDSTFEPTA